MATIRSFVKREPVLLIAALAALVSCFLVPPDGAYIGYIDFRTLALLYCLMTVVAGLRQAGLFAHLAHVLCQKASSVRTMGALLVLLCFFSSSSLSAIKVVSSAYMRLLIFLPAILIPAWASSSPAFLMMYSAYKLNKQGDNI